jgi:PAS domain S-box-containing protein
MDGDPRFPERTWKDLIELAVDAILLVGEDRRIWLANHQACELTLWREEDLRNQPMSVLFSPGELARAPLDYDTVSRGHTVRRTRTLTRKDGTEVPVEMTSKRMPDGTFQTFLRDMTDQVRALRELKLSEEKYAKAFKTSPDAINLTRLADGCYLEINEGFTRMTGYTSEDVVGRSALPGDLGIWDSAEDRARVVAELRATGQVIGYEAPFRRKDGGLVIGLMSGKLIEIEGQACFLSVTRDITEKKKTEEALARSEQLEALGVLAGGIAHDFNNLLTGIFGYIAAARDRLPDRPEVQGLLDEALGVHDRAKALSRQLLTFAKGGAPVKQAVDLEELLGETVHFALAGSRVAADLSIAPGLWACDADRHQIGQVIDNLLINARDVLPDGGTVAVTARNLAPGDPVPVPLTPGPYVRVTVADNGPGIPPDVLPRIFDPYFTTKSKGHGLGLATSYSILRRHGGHLSAESSPGEGARFTFYLPALGAPPAQETPTPASSAVPKAGRILLLDDEDFIREIGGLLLTGLGCLVTATRTGPETLDRFRTAREQGAPFDLVFLDLTIPGEEGGVEVLKALGGLDPTVRAVATSGYSDDPVMAEPGRFGFAASLAKPYGQKDLRALLDRLL